MTIDPKNDPEINDSERKDLSLAMELAHYVKEELQKLDRSVQDQVRTALQANAATVRRIDNLEGSVNSLKTDLEARAYERVDKDFREAEARYILAREQKDRLSTQEKIQVQDILEDRETAARKARADRWRALFDKITPNIASAMILAVLIPVWLAIVIAILIFILRALGIAVPDIPS